MSEQSFFSGPERLQLVPALARSVRAAHPDALRVAEPVALLARLREGLRDEAATRLAMMLEQALGMAWIYAEWAVQMPATLVACAPGADERAVTRAAYERWVGDIAPLASDPVSTSLVELAMELLAVSRVDATSGDTLRAALAARERHDLHVLTERIEASAAAVRQHIERNEVESASTALEAFLIVARTVHDVLAQYTTSYPDEVLERFGQATGEAVIRHSYFACSYRDGLFDLVGALSPEHLAAWLAEHLRAHFSGPLRDGAVTVVEEPDRYRLVFERCGSGGAQRQRLARIGRGPACLPEASPLTWGRAGEVGTYCAHCALNELHMTELFGAPLLVTEFDPDPEAPCGWTVYKDRDGIPERYFARLGLTKPNPDAQG